jgi:GT2 family glycosyltransferase
MKRFLPWKVLHLSIRDPYPDLIAEADVGGFFIVFWCDRVPLGQLLIAAPLLPMPSAQLSAAVPAVIAPAVGHRLLRTGFDPSLQVPSGTRVGLDSSDLKCLFELAQPLELLARRADAEAPSRREPSISLVICTRNRPEPLERCLSSIRDLSPGPQEIIVVDNDPASGLTRSVAERFPEVRYVPEPRPGLSAARNAGVRQCRGAIIAFTDDDVIVDPGWIGALAAGFNHQGDDQGEDQDDDQDVIAVTGLVLPAELETRAQFIFQVGEPVFGWEYRAITFDRAFFVSTRRLGARVWRLGAGANMAFRREAFERVGLFDERLGAGAAGCSEDSELWYRLLAEGYRCRYVPTAVVFHHHRAGWKELRHQTYSYMRGHVAALFIQFERYRHWGNIYRAFVALPLYLVKVARSTLERRAARLIYHRPDEEWLAPPLAPQILGVIAGYGYYVRHWRRRADAAKLAAPSTAHAWALKHDDETQAAAVHVPEP